MPNLGLHDRLLHAGFTKTEYRGMNGPAWNNLKKKIRVSEEAWSLLAQRVWVCVDFRDNYARGFGSESAACEHALERAEARDDD